MWLSVLCAALACLSSAVAGSGVVVLTDSNFDELTSSGTWLVEFYAPWCGHCKALAPVFDRVADRAEGKAQLGKVDCTEERELSRRFEIKGYPTIKFIREGDVRVYKHGRTEEAFMSFIESVSGPAVTTAETVEDVVEAMGEEPLAFVFCGSSSGQTRRVFDHTARRMQGIRPFIASSSKDVASKYCGGSAEPTVAVISEGIDGVIFPGPFEEDVLKEWLESHQFPLVSELDQFTFGDLTSSGKLVIFAVTNPHREVTERYLKTLRSVARDYIDKFVFANIDGVQYDKYVAQFGLSEENFPIIFGFDYPNEQFYPPEANVAINTKSKMKQFLDDVHEGRIPARTVGVWWSPARLFRWFEKWLSQFSDEQLMFGTVGVVVVIAGLVYWLFCTGDDDDEELAGQDGGGDKSTNGGRRNKGRRDPPAIEEDDSDDGSSARLRKRKGK